ncbi:MAG TPA: aldolase/citrate lyase family protein [Phenylobacterium sp.]|jgi:4-hydroxy-2-oxoheptanedioate aldolase|uniref:HpcH/HpaI aldolase family protein n=1 Tax=Phenylobacterium sp. TaxID=1871053 RepID=UPI002B92923E|nr:aldolase/citrate lyase family protein [Phenylobacterium sp.]HXA38437.1 aldolase/citrate lyase family protein [Phenylobacterium sp.]
MRANRLKELWASGKPAINGWCSMPGGFSAELMASMGWDAVTVDTQHGLIGYSEMLAMLQAVSTTPVTPLVRVSWNQPGKIMRALDAGAYGVICPMINDAVECAAFVQACRYPPEGFRSSGPTRAIVYGGPDYHAKANGEMLAIAMIETAQGLANVEAIVATPGLDGVYIGPSDLSLSIGGPPGQDSDAPALMAAFDRILAACKAAGVRIGVHTNSMAYSQKMIDRGFDLVTVGSDTRYMGAGRREASEMRAWMESR